MTEKYILGIFPKSTWKNNRECIWLVIFLSYMKYTVYALMYASFSQRKPFPQVFSGWKMDSFIDFCDVSYTCYTTFIKTVPLSMTF